VPWLYFQSALMQSPKFFSRRWLLAPEKLHYLRDLTRWVIVIAGSIVAARWSRISSHAVILARYSRTDRIASAPKASSDREEQIERFLILFQEICFLFADNCLRTAVSVWINLEQVISLFFFFLFFLYRPFDIIYIYILLLLSLLIYWRFFCNRCRTDLLL